MRVLAIRGGGLGDIILTVPSFLALKEISKELFLSVPSQWLPLFEGFSQLIPLEGNLISSIWKGGDEFEKAIGKFDIVITWHYDKEGFFVRNLERIARKVIVGDIKPKNGIHQSLNLFSPILEINKGIRFPQILKLSNLPSWKPEKKSEIIIHPGSGSMKKVWGIENFLFLARKFLSENKRVKVILGEAELREKFSVFNELKGADIKVNPSIKELVKELLDGIVFIGNDSGVSHLSALLGIPTVVIFKETDPEIWAPKGERVHIISTYPGKEWVKKEEVLEFVLSNLRSYV